MLNNLTNFFNLITGRRIKTQLEDSDLIPIGTKQSPALGDYKPTAIKFEDLQAQVGGLQTVAVDGITITGNGTPSNPLVGASGASWGSITGTLSTQLDLQSALNAKNNLISHLQFNNTNKTIWNQGNSSNSLSYGSNALASVTSALNCTALGNGALQNNISGHTNTAIGTNALQLCTTGTLNTAVGPFAQLALTTGVHNTSIGYRSLRNTSTGGYNIAIGNDCFLNNTTGNANIGIGWSCVSNNWNNSMALGHNVAFTGDNQIHFGSSGNTLGVVTTESVAQAQTWTVFINGVQRKILLA